ncbi:MAG TPA: HK97 family phage prohead protease [Limnochordales bacterium]
MERFDESAGTVEGYASTWDRDEDGDVIVKGAFAKTIKERVPAGKVKLLDSHRWDAQHVIGTVVEAREEDRGLWIKAAFAGTDEAQAIRQKVLEGHLNSFSIGFEILRDEVKLDEQGRPTRYIYEVKLYEVSIVPFPANENAIILSAKGVVPFQDLPLADRDRAWDADAAVQRVRRWASSDGSGEKDTINWARYRRAFVWYDSANPENFGAYKLPIADVIDGQLRAVPRAIFTAAAVVQGARGGVDIPDSDLPGVRNHLARYYRKLGETPPWERDSLDLLLTEIKAGRRNSAADFERIASAMALLWEVLNDDERQKVLERLGLAPAAGPADEPPPTDGGEKGAATEPPADVSALMAELELLDAELALMEVE